jgi:hypothetical protein
VTLKKFASGTQLAGRDGFVLTPSSFLPVSAAFLGVRAVVIRLWAALSSSGVACASLPGFRAAGAG